MLGTDGSFVDYYELMQISPNAEFETIQRVFRMLAARFHPDNLETGDTAKFVLLNEAYKTLSDPELRAEYDLRYRTQNTQPIEVFELREFAAGIEGEPNRRMGILCLLYKKRRSNPDSPGMSILELEALMSFPREHLMFTLWYLKEQDCLRQDDQSNFVITGGGVDYVETNLRSDHVLYRLLKAGETGGTRAKPTMAREESTVHA
jgi:curved DNA-binding protein CbpA